MLVCPVCHHELPLPSLPPTDLSSSTSSHGLPPPSPKFTKIDGGACSTPPTTKTIPLCHVTPSCQRHSSVTCTHSSSSCRLRASCHVFPYTCGCSLNNYHQLQQQQARLLDQSSNHHRASLPTNSLFVVNHGQQATSHFLNGAHSSSSLSHHHHTSGHDHQNTAIDLSGLKLGSNNFTSCPTSPLPNTTNGNGVAWPVSSADVSQAHHFNSKLMCGGKNSEPPSHQCCPKQFQSNLQRAPSLVQQGSNGLQCPEEQLAALHHVCLNGSCGGSKPGYRRQLSCPNGPCAAAITCPCVPEHQSLHSMNSTPLPCSDLCNLSNNCELNSTTITSTTTTTLPHNQKLSTQIQLQYSDSVQQYPVSQQHATENNIVILNSTGGGGFIFERKSPSRTNSPELKFTVSLPSQNKTDSGRNSPLGSDSNTISFDRETLLQTLASLPPVGSCAGNTHNSSFSSTSSNDFSNISSSLNSSTVTASTRRLSPEEFSSCSSSSSSSPISFQQPKDSKQDLSVNQLHHLHDVKTRCQDTANEMTVSSLNGRFTLNVRSVIIPNPGCERLPQMPPKPTDEWTSTDDARVLRNARSELEESGFYYGGLTWRDANDVLAAASEGSFLVRDSFSGRCLYALSIKTAVGPTSVRIEYERGKFMLQSESRAREGVPQRPCVVGLVQAYTETFNPSDVWVDHSGRTVSSISVTKPLRQKPASLQHFARLAYHRKPEIHAGMYDTLPALIKAYISSYSHTCWPDSCNISLCDLLIVKLFISYLFLGKKGLVPLLLMIYCYMWY